MKFNEAEKERMGSRSISPYCVGLVCLLFCSPLYAQQHQIDSLRRLLSQGKTEDTTRVNLLVSLGAILSESGRADTASILLARAGELAGRLQYARGQALTDIWMGQVQCFLHNEDDGLKRLHRGIETARSLEVKSPFTAGLFILGRTYKQLQRNDESEAAFAEALQSARASRDSLHQMRILSDLGGLLHRLGKMEKAADCFFASLTIAGRLNRPNSKAVALMNLANTIPDPRKSIVYLKEAQAIFVETRDSVNIATCCVNLGARHQELGERLPAIRLYEEALLISDRLHRENVILFCLYNLAVSYHDVFNDSLSTVYGKRHLALAEKLQNKSEMAASHMHLGAVAASKKDFPLAVEHLGAGLRVAKKINEWPTMQDAYQLLMMVYEDMNEPAKALSALKEFDALEDSVNAIEKQKHINELMVLHETEKKQQRILMLENERKLQAVELMKRHLEALTHHQQMDLLLHKSEIQALKFARTSDELIAERKETSRRKEELRWVQKEQAMQASLLTREKSIRTLIIAGFLAVLIISALVYRRLRDKKYAEQLRAEAAEHKAHAAEYQARAVEAQSLALIAETERREKEAQKMFSQTLIQSQESERKRIAGDLHDGIGQELLVIKNSALLAMQNEGLDAKTRQYIEHIAATTSEALTDVRQMSRELRPFQLDRFGLTETLTSMIGKIRETTTIAFSTGIENIDGLFDKEKEINVYRLVQEGVNNILKHSAASEAAVRIARQDGSVQVTVVDNGKGFGKEQPFTASTAGFGIHGMMERVSIMGGTISIASNENTGAVVTIVLPVESSPIGDKS